MLKNLSIGKKFTAAFSLIGIAVVIFGFYIFTQVSGMRDNMLNFTDDTLPAVLEIERLNEEIIRIRQDQYAVLTFDDPATRREILGEIDVMKRDYSRALDAYEESLWYDNERAIFTRIQNHWDQYNQELSAFPDRVEAGQLTAAQKILSNSFGTFGQLDKSLKEMSELTQGFIDSNRTSMLNQVSTVSMTIIGVLLAVIAFMIVVAVVFTRAIINPLRMVMEQSSAIAKGDLTYQLDRSQIGNDEMGKLADSSIAMQDSLRSLIEEVIAAVTQLSSAVEEVSAVSSQTSTGMQNQQHEVSQVATAMAQMKATVADVAQNTESSSTAANEASEQSRMGAQDIDGMVASIRKVAEDMRQTGDTVSELDQQSKQINMVVDVIRDIAEQTNLLALNAAIEAARAGESGRGFAVVADEVRTLAGRTQDSTGEITTIIEKLQQFATQASNATTQSCESIEQCVEQGDQAQQLVRGIETSVENIADMGMQIASACGEQDSVADELSRNIERINDSAQEVAGGADQTAQACSELSQLAQSLQSTMQRFRLTK
ncbi:methyl-accepting chemotaxis protein [Salinivibrio kushneri]|uniref:methyl-accepting chemotaxis protein n=1 Tax=Salinivibrio kushneri TaxID=1908198 RepID=UPI000986C816|nr:methyl-accepting chemotaxis protein [Salinivibrio kushneri]OOE35616.1 methyl-accepting chemotaxis protein [Salinivibrio kushneri]OOE48336.1 methyl-accepting chemotaxis protein [Salinivibrio kushneri]OOE53178.1 methyl-accepting chemotaxis protein [Salinivibrio kushneri]OOE61822.1 methyl-accepting chemotaxis protein [Salinivibrio kushneri]WBA11406.1 methyl-accepting chemotaxis protein [Salinivibrio kushneri]